MYVKYQYLKWPAVRLQRSLFVTRRHSVAGKSPEVIVMSLEWSLVMRMFLLTCGIIEFPTFRSGDVSCCYQNTSSVLFGNYLVKL